LTWCRAEPLASQHPDHFFSANPILEHWPSRPSLPRRTYERGVIANTMRKSPSGRRSMATSKSGGFGRGLQTTLRKGKLDVLAHTESRPTPASPTSTPSPSSSSPATPTPLSSCSVRFRETVSCPSHREGPRAHACVVYQAVDHSMFWLPRETTIITGDCMYGRPTHVCELCGVPIW
jgi:hypothetical protein